MQESFKDKLKDALTLFLIMSGGWGVTRFWFIILLIGMAAFLVGFIFLHFFFAAQFGWAFIALLWYQFYISTIFKTKLQRSFKVFILLPLASAIAGHYLFDWLGWPNWLAHSFLLAWVLIQHFILRMCSRSPYWLWRLLPDTAYFPYSEWLYNDKISFENWLWLVQKWREKNDSPAISQFFSELTVTLAYRPENYTQLLQLLASMLPFWPPDLIQEADYPAISKETAFKLISNDDSRQIFMNYLFANPDFAPQFGAVFGLCNQYIDDFIEEPTAYPYETPYFLQENMLEKVEQALAVEAEKLTDFPDIQAQWQYFYGLHYMAIGIAQNMATYEETAEEREDSSEEEEEN